MVSSTSLAGAAGVGAPDGLRVERSVGLPGVNVAGRDESALQTLRDLAELASKGVRGCDGAGITLLNQDEGSTVAATNDRVRDVDNAQYRKGDGPCLHAIRQAETVRVDDFSVDRRWADVAAQACAAGIHSSLSVPLHDGRTVVGGLNLYADDPHAFSEDDRRVAEVIGRQGGVTLRYLQLLQRERDERAAEHRIAEALQRSLLPQLPVLREVTCAARYQVGDSDSQVGGDWYDAFALPDGAIGVAIGDVMGHDMVAAAAMGQLRSVLRSYAYEGSTPAVVLDRMDRLVQDFDMAQTATALYARLVVDHGGALMLYANAGHLPPLLHRPDGTVQRLLGGASRLIGAPVRGQASRTEGAVSLPPGSTLVLYTDGLVENRELPVDVGIDRVAAAIARCDPGGSVEELCDRVMDTMLDRRVDDDVALLAVRVGHATQE